MDGGAAGRNVTVRNLRALLTVLFVVLLLLAGCGTQAEQGTEQASESPESANVPEVSEGASSESSSGEAPDDETLRLTVPGMDRVQDVVIPTGPGNDEELLKENAAVHLLHTGYPWEEEANVYIAGHRLGYRGTDSYLAFYDIDRLGEGDEIFVTDSNGKRYTYRVFETLTVEPTEIDVLNPIEGKNIISLQACTLPDYSDRVIVRGELVSS